jgi:Predicted hydrolases or acyltransferases (alpha/beta hydrolase superfamily)
MEEMFISLPNADVYYWRNDFQSTKQTLLLVHGFRGDHNGLRFIAENLANEYNVIVPDLPGFGKSGKFKSGKHDLDNYVDTLNDFIKSLRLKKKPVLVAHSFGTIISAKLAYEAPELSSKDMVLICPIATTALSGLVQKTSDKLIGAAYFLPENVGKRITGSKVVADVVSAKMTRTKDKETKKLIKEEHRKHFGKFASNKSMLEGLRATNNNSVGMFARDIDKRVLLIATEFDDVTSVQKQRRLKKLFKNAELRVLKDTGHLVHYEAPDEAAAVIADFLG